MTESLPRRPYYLAFLAALALTSVLLVDYGPATAQTTTQAASTPTAHATQAAPTSTSASPTPSPSYGQTDPCSPPSTSNNPDLSVTMTTPVNGSTVSGVVTFQGKISRLSGAPAGTIHNTLTVISAVGSQPVQWTGEGDYSVQWVTNGGNYADGKYGVQVGSWIDNGQYTANKVCLFLANGNAAAVGSGGMWTDPFYVTRGDLMLFHFDYRGEATFRPQTAFVPLSIDGQTIVTVQVTPVAWSVATGGYAYEITGDYAYRTFHSSGQHEVSSRLSFDLGQPTEWHWSNQWSNGFRVVEDGATPTGTPPTTSAASPTMRTITDSWGATATTTQPPGTSTPVYGWTTPTATAPTLTPPTSSPTEAEPSRDSWIDPSAIGFGTVRPQVNESMTILTRLQNPLSETARGTFRVAVTGPDRNDVTIREEEVYLGPHEYRIIRTSWSPTDQGDHLVEATFRERPLNGPPHQIKGSSSAVARLFVGEGQTQTPILVMSAGLINIGTLEEGATRTIPVTVTAYNQYLSGVKVIALDPGQVKVRSLTPPTDLAPGQSATFYLQVEVPRMGENQTLASQSLIVMARAAGLSSNVETLSLVVHHEGFAGVPYFGSGVAIATVAGTGALTAFFRRRGGNPPV